MKCHLLAIIFFGVIALPGYAEGNREDYDLDDDGLIEINDLQDLNEIRNNANGASLYQSSIGCELGQPRPYCAGFELTTDLDFDTNQNGIFDEGDAYWNGGEGWEPLPLFMASFNGNDYTIRNLTINRPTQDNQGLFGAIFGDIRYLHLFNVSIIAASTAGAIAGFLEGDSHAFGTVTGEIRIITSRDNRADYDLDDDGLIEINDLQDLNEIRNSPMGQSLYGQSEGCDNCAGFELTTDLDFDTNQNGAFDQGDTFWNGGEGWIPLSLSAAHFDGNGFAIRNLTINRPGTEKQALFSDAINSSVNHLAMLDVSIRAAITSSALVAFSNSSNFNGIFVTGEIYGEDYNLGGLIGHSAASRISNVFSSVNVHAGLFSGAIVGYVGEGTILSTVLAVGKVDLSAWDYVGLGDGSYGYFINSYMAIDVSGRTYDNAQHQIGSFAARLNELKCPVSANNTDCIPGKILYQGWDKAPNADYYIYWDFGTNQQLPGLSLNEHLYRIDVVLNTSSSSSSSSSSPSSSSSSVSSSASHSSLSSSSKSNSSSSSKKKKPKHKHKHKHNRNRKH